MRRLSLAAVVLVALVASSYAVAHGIEGAKSAKAVAGTFTATASSVSTRTCTTSDGKTIVVTDGRYTGAATGDPDLTGAITLRARSTVNTTDGVGVVNGRFRIDVASARDTEAGFSTVYDHGNIAGLAAGRAHDPSAKLIANMSAGFVAATGFTGGKIGGGTAPGSAVELSAAGGCKPAQQNAEKSEARGAISALSTTSITVAFLTCAIPADKSADVNAKFKQGDMAEIHCAVVNGQNTLTRIEKKR
ncbi:MAG: hypothetical protein HOQ28_03455 [Thermoleophilia bacterium]|nr:hypothetical protein [Thermoleophilia bacterium]